MNESDRTGPARVVMGAFRSLVTLPQPGPPRYGVATRAGLAIAVPLFVLTLLGQQEIGLQTSAGAFIALFAAQANAKERAKALPFVFAALILSALLGVLLNPWPWAFAIGLVFVAVSTSALCFGFRVGPPGPVFFVLAYGLASNVTAVVDGVRVSNPLVFLAAMCGGSLFAYILAILPVVLPSQRQLPTRPLRELFPGPWFGSEELVLVARIAFASVVGTAVSLIWLDQGHAYWTVCASIAVVGLVGGRRFSLQRGLHRMVGTFIGALAFMLIAPVVTYPLLLAVLIGALQFAIELVVVRNYALALTMITPLVLLITTSVSTNSDFVAFALERVVDTVVGAVLAIVTALLHRK
ncbi:FUSC family protein [Leucobacter denitrificans]|uniref:FUSC family protein n=1 Tax=Leucobacter denitrificans TaxID=683042 RepID=A0A7G9S2U9_9MICO|nr:FUSC family protein [Leucobacter denitrificans]QNN62174.1 FUSC family protein [Leucobacter denitrificans]